jgi:fructose-bisphosphate aldolase class II
MTGAIRKVFAEKPEEFDPRKYLGPARAALQAMVAQRMRDFGAAGNAGKIEQKPLQ